MEEFNKTIVISAVSIRKGGTLTILRNCLEYLSGIAKTQRLRIVALVHDKTLAFYPHIEYLEFPGIINRWDKRLWCEYHTMMKVSKKLQPIYLWLSLHDTTPHVLAHRQAVYCQTAFPFFRWKARDLKYSYKIVLFALFIKYAYRINIKKNRYLIVQANWLKEGFSRMFHIDKEKFIVAPPQLADGMTDTGKGQVTGNEQFQFIYPATADCHKNFEIICKAAALLEEELGENRFIVTFTINGHENAYSKWLFKRWGYVKSIEFSGFMSKEELFRNYRNSDCMIFPSRIETWGLPITEFSRFGKPILLADLPYAHETSAGLGKIGYFPTDKPRILKSMMAELVKGNTSFLKDNPGDIKIADAKSWHKLFEILLSE